MEDSFDSTIFISGLSPILCWPWTAYLGDRLGLELTGAVVVFGVNFSKI
jgi:small basic protein